MPHKVNAFIFLLISLISLCSLKVQGHELSHDGFLRLYNTHLDETLEIVYEKDGQLLPEALKKLNFFLRSRDNGEVIAMNVDLIHLLDHIQDHFKADTLEIISGYRRPVFNASLRAKGHNVAEGSYHTKGMASDIHLDEVAEKDIAHYARRLKRGGVGYYPDLMMVHLDVGRVNAWQEDSFSNRTNIGKFTDLNVLLKTDAVFYGKGRLQSLTLWNPSSLPTTGTLVLEHFFRGKWKNAGGLIIREGLATNLSSKQARFEIPLDFSQASTEKALPVWMYPVTVKIPYGKFRWKLETIDGRVQYSNEFYLKRM